MTRHANREDGGPSGILPIDKPTGMTSHDAVDTVRRLYGTRRVGHSGTLDPAASGLLLMLIGRATKVASLLTAHSKTYLASICLGTTSDTGDADGRLTLRPGDLKVSRAELAETTGKFVGTITQEVPRYAAVRSGGRRRYELARRGLPVPFATREVQIHSLDLLTFKSPQVVFRVCCSKGTYIRSLAEAIGRDLGCGAYLSSLRRECIGHHSLKEAMALETLCRDARQGRELPRPEPIEDFLDLPAVEIPSACADAVRHGQPIRTEDIVRIDGSFREGADILLRLADGTVAAIVQAHFDSENPPQEQTTDPILRYRRVLI